GSARGNDRMKSRNRTASYNDKDKRQYRTTDDRPSTMNERRNCRHLNSGLHKDYTHCEHKNSSYLKIGGQIITWNQQQPHRQYGSKKTIHRNSYRNGFHIPMEKISYMIILHQAMPSDNSYDKQDPAKDACQQHGIFPIPHQQPHDNRYRHCYQYRKERP